jgi:hypothetical protein
MTPSHFSSSNIRLKSGVCNVCHSAFHRRRCSPTLWPLWVIYLVREWAYVAWTWRCVGYLGGGRFTTGVVDDRSVCGEFSSVFLSHFQCSKLIRADKSGRWKRRSMCWLVIKAFLSAYLVKFSRTCCSINGQCCASWVALMSWEEVPLHRWYPLAEIPWWRGFAGAAPKGSRHNPLGRNTKFTKRIPLTLWTDFRVSFRLLMDSNKKLCNKNYTTLLCKSSCIARDAFRF